MSETPAAERPDYIVHTLDEDELTVDWFFGRRTALQKLPQLLAAVVGWFFSILPIWITISAIANRHDDRKGWWSYHEGFVMFEVAMIVLGILFAFFVLGFFALYLADRRADGWRRENISYDLERLDLRLAIAESIYARKFGPESARLAQRHVRIEPLSDFETYELRDSYRDYEVGVD